MQLDKLDLIRNRMCVDMSVIEPKAQLAWVSRCALAVTLLCGAGAVGAEEMCKPKAHAKVPIKAENTYTNERKALITAGWQPVPTASWRDKDAKFFGQALYFWDKGFEEVIDCAGTGLAPCHFQFRDVYGNKLIVATSGEEIPDKKLFARVVSFYFDCTDSPNPRRDKPLQPGMGPLIEAAAAYLGGHQLLREYKASPCGHQLMMAIKNHETLVKSEVLPAIAPADRAEVAHELTKYYPVIMAETQSLVRDYIAKANRKLEQTAACKAVAEALIKVHTDATTTWQQQRQLHGYQRYNRFD